MISRLSFYESQNLNPAKNLAMEEYLTFHTKEEECILYLWQNQKTVVIGKNQNAWRECKIKSLSDDGGHLVRRLSGGGAVFHDIGNLNFTFCVRKENYDVPKQLSVIVEAVRMLGGDAKKTGRNDITIDGQKFSGNAFFESGDYCYHHGTIMLDVDKDSLSDYLNVSKEKLASHGVKSVRSRVINLKEICPEITVSLMKARLIQAFEMVYGLHASQIEESEIPEQEVETLKERYESWDWTYGRKIPFHDEMEKRFPWGNVHLQFAVNEGKITELNCYSDAMDGEWIAKVPAALTGQAYELDTLIRQMNEMKTDGVQEEFKKDIIALLRENF